MTTLGGFARSVRHTPARQLVQRIRLSAKRRSAEALSWAFPLGRWLDRGPEPAIAAMPPTPIFPPRESLAERRDGRWHARFLGLDVPIEPVADWRPEAWCGPTRLELMTLHYMEWAEGLDDAAFAAVVDDWIERVHPYAPRYWLDAWNSYALSIRVVVWMQQLAIRRARLDEAFVSRCARSIVAQLRFLERNLETDIRGNHIIRNIKALLWAGRMFDGPDARRWQRLGMRLLSEELVAQVLPDGVHFERSPAYHAQVTADLLECARVLPADSACARLGAALDRMAQVVCDLAHPDGRVSLFSDGGLTMTYGPHEILVAFHALRGALLRPAKVFALPTAGFYGARSGDDFVLVKCGRIGADGLPAHAHGDALAFEWSIGGERLVVDAGVFEYHAGPMRTWARATRSHNTVTVDDADQAEFYGAFRVGRRPNVTCDAWERREEGFALTGSHDGFAPLRGGPIHRRTFDALPSRVEVRDRVEGGRGQAVLARLLLHPDTAVEPERGGAILRRGSVRARLTTSHAWSLGTTWWCPDFGVKRTAPQIAITYGKAPCGGGFLLQRIG